MSEFEGAENQAGLKSKAIFARANAVPVEAPAYLKTRVLAQFREKTERKKKLRFWQMLASVSLGLAVVFVALFTLKDPTLKASTGMPIAVRIEVEELTRQQVAFAEIELPDSVRFFSATRPELKEQRKLALSVAQNGAQKQMPFVIESSEKGLKEIKLKLYNAQNELVGERFVKIKFI